MPYSLDFNELTSENAGITPVVPVPVTNPHGGEVNLINSALVIVLIHVVPIIDLEPADLSTSGSAVNILSEEHGT
ncbi:hypothetical protein Megpolyxen_00369 [Candidatus Megaera polyxenophila]|nr:hypothetical protein Megpolyxen_00369 [Candidatus Megaera polyxenophila]